QIAAVLPENIDDRHCRIPAQAAPDDLVDIVIATFRIADEADGGRSRGGKDLSFRNWPRINRLAPFGQGEGDVPVPNGILDPQAMRDVGIEANGIAFWNGGPHLIHGEARLRAVDHAC